MQSTFDILPCPNNLFCWKLSTDSLCTLCKSPFATVSHILSGCKVALKQGKYTYRHGNILADIVKCLQDFLATYNPSLPSEDDNIKHTSMIREDIDRDVGIWYIQFFLTKQKLGKAFLHFEFITSFTFGIWSNSSLKFFRALPSIELSLRGDKVFISCISDLYFLVDALALEVASSSKVKLFSNSFFINLTHLVVVGGCWFLLLVLSFGEKRWGRNGAVGKTKSGLV